MPAYVIQKERQPLSPPQKLPLGILIKIAIIEKKIESARGTTGRGKRRDPEVSLLSFPFPSCSLRSLFFSPQPPHNTERPLRRRERQRSHLVPEQGARVRYSLDTNVNTPFFKYTSRNSDTVPEYKFETLYSGGKKWAPGLCVPPCAVYHSVVTTKLMFQTGV